MRRIDSLRPQLLKLDGKDYMAYQSLKGHYTYPDFELFIDQIPKDPYAPPFTGVYRARVPKEISSFPEELTKSKIAKTALCDFLTRMFFTKCSKICKGRRGTGNSGIITIAEPKQEILERTAMVVEDEFLEARFFMGLPGNNRAISAKVAQTMFFDELPKIVRLSLLVENLDMESIYKHCHLAEDAAYLRKKLDELNLVAFIADGSILPRISGVNPEPLTTGNVIPFKSPESLEVSIELPHSGNITGMGIPEGVCLIVGGGYHGKSTLLQALEVGIYNHIPGDGREFCVSVPQTVKVQASSGRSVINADISAFINNVPQQRDTVIFSTENASGSTSQAAFLSESIEAGAKVFLMDEDTCAANFMIRDKRMQELVAKKDEPITAFVDLVKNLYEEFGISTVLVMGGSGDYFDVADCVIQMVEFEPKDVTTEAIETAKSFPTERQSESGRDVNPPRKRVPILENLSPKNEYGHFRITSNNPKQLTYGKSSIDLSDIDQIMETAQAKAIGKAIHYLAENVKEKLTISEIIDKVDENLAKSGMDILDDRLTGDLAEFRAIELALVINRIRELEIVQVE